MAKELKRAIRSFVRREGRMTPGQRQSIEQYWPQFGLSTEDGLLVMEAVFGRKRDIILEIGFGMGQSLVQMACDNPELDYIGVEVHRPGIGACLQQVMTSGITNIRLFQEDVMEVLRRSIPDNSLSGVQIFFPDPWPKLRHHKRRLVQLDFIELLWQKLKVGGKVHLATDWQDYAEHMMRVMTNAPGFMNVAGHGNFTVNANLRPKTKFEVRGEKLGHGVWDLIFIKT